MLIEIILSQATPLRLKYLRPWRVVVPEYDMSVLGTTACPIEKWSNLFCTGCSPSCLNFSRCVFWVLVSPLLSGPGSQPLVSASVILMLIVGEYITTLGHVHILFLASKNEWFSISSHEKTEGWRSKISKKIRSWYTNLVVEENWENINSPCPSLIPGPGPVSLALVRIKNRLRLRTSCRRERRGFSWNCIHLCSKIFFGIFDVRYIFSSFLYSGMIVRIKAA